MLTVVCRAENRKGKAFWDCVCDCGIYKESISARALRQGLVISCGCQHNSRETSDVVLPKVKAYRKKYYEELKQL